MLKMYHRHGESGSSAAYWEDFGGTAALGEHMQFCDVDPLRPLFVRFLKPGSVMLEGGCGRGQYVAYYSERGAKVVGLDFARGWLAAARAERPSLLLCAGDVGRLPFPDATFDVYYSGGVVEHFEGGAERALAEARRVLKRDGVLLLSVPYFSPLRRALSWIGRAGWRRVAGPSVDERSEGPLRFYQYAYTIPEFTRLLTAAGFTVLETRGYAVVWGLYDVGLIERIAVRLAHRRGAGPANRLRQGYAGQEAGHHAQVPEGGHHVPSILKRLIVAEDDTVPVAGRFVKLARWLCANMMMYVCVPSNGRQAA